MSQNQPKKRLADLISEHAPNGLRAEIDNDCWTLIKVTPEPPGFDKWEWEHQDAWRQEQVICDDRSPFVENPPYNGYGSGNCHGGDLLQALAEIVGMEVRSV